MLVTGAIDFPGYARVDGKTLEKEKERSEGERERDTK
jgi:hypothetical protein